MQPVMTTIPTTAATLLNVSRAHTLVIEPVMDIVVLKTNPNPPQIPVAQVIVAVVVRAQIPVHRLGHVAKQHLLT